MRISDWSSDVCSSDLGSTPSWTDPGNILQAAGNPRLLPFATVPGDGKAVCLVADLLHQLQRRRCRAGFARAAIGQDQGFIAGAPRPPFGDANDDHTGPPATATARRGRANGKDGGE